MIKPFVEIYMNNKEELRSRLSKKLPRTWKSLITIVFKLLSEKMEEDETLDKPILSKIRVIRDSNHDGVLLYIIPFEEFPVRRYYYVLVEYGTCSGCDILIGALDTNNKTDKINNLMHLALHVIQRIKIIKYKEN